MNIETFSASRRNHALEHATLAILYSRLGPRARMVGRATTDGFYIYGNVPTEAVAEAAQEALARLQRGEGELAISPFCGTNLAVAGVLAGVGAALGLGKGGLQRLPRAILVGLGAVMAAQPLGRLVQKYLTTSPNLSDIRIASVTRLGKGRFTLHKVETART